MKIAFGNISSRFRASGANTAAARVADLMSTLGWAEEQKTRILTVEPARVLGITCDRGGRHVAPPAVSF